MMLYFQNSYILGNIWAAHMDKEIFPQGESFKPGTLIDSKGKFIRNDSMMMFTAGKGETHFFISDFDS